jgi:ribonucleotide monophosphatase NagD (HAD superfamily)
VQGINTTLWSDVPYCNSLEPWDVDDLKDLQIDRYSAVVLGFTPSFSYRHLCFASAVLLETPGCRFIGTNPDLGDRISSSRIMPGTGCLISALEKASGRKAVRPRGYVP